MKIKKNIFVLLFAVLAIIATIFFLEKMNGPPEQKINKELIAGTDFSSPRVVEKAREYPRAIELVNPSGYLNVKNITISENIGKNIVLVDFWTYSCINCQRTIPYLNQWYEKYRDRGLVIIGVHTPEFEFERERDNVAKAIEKYYIKYPVVQDNERATWYAYKNRFWPRKYLIDIDGFIIYDHIGEGGYEETERKIQELLKERVEILGLNVSIEEQIKKEDISVIPSEITPEIYFGYKYNRNQIGNKEGWQNDNAVIYSLPSNLEKNKFYLYGKWKNNPDHMALEEEKGKILLKYLAKEVHFVAGAKTSTEIEVFIDGDNLNNITIENYGLYTILNDSSYKERVVELRTTSGLQAYTFTFG